MSGLFISLDGIDGCGKSTQLALLATWLESKNRTVQVVRDPGGTQLGESLREILLHRHEIELDTTAEMLLYMASRAELVAEVVRPALAADKVVLADRYLLANVVYQGYGGGLAAEDVWQVGRIATQGLQPDLTLILDIDPEVAQGRMGNQPDRLESRGIEYMRRVRDGFLKEADKLDGQTAILDAS
ncbi:MAG: dTMP kinase, partial [bacterium]|nr:dTMP kinase [bacterium]